MAQESFESWVGTMAEPFREWYGVLKDSIPQRAVRYTACGLLGLAALSGGAAVYESTIGYPDGIYTSEERLAAEATAQASVGARLDIAFYSGVAGLAVLGAGVVANNRR